MPVENAEKVLSGCRDTKHIMVPGHVNAVGNWVPGHHRVAHKPGKIWGPGIVLPRAGGFGGIGNRKGAMSIMR